MSGATSRSKKPPSLREVFAKNLRLQRLHLGMSQEALAAEASLDRAFVGTLERGERNVSIDNVERLCVAVNVPAHELLDPEFAKRWGLDESLTRAPRRARV
ncbi:helix-turn-helix domain-containing protein [Caenimonas sp. SL110]|uniref:helix-turn-helix domain-containing protein n=1 Tax=Caenimonas sp. SL110 TaxID=1450524 RepID=UPI0006542EDF|nr:helix-turn-helix transcriptional regulator [Caenimonas sp. SL110]